ncbi:aquaporin family protein [Arthrobacter crusticola]|uniref:Aquaporin family protein n=1 Tax=Arthrobacter crusticola TaxID=2547960 RepID=A0A4V3AM44_9MICC|nr:aquaporin [Arthrobacter crusticola]TDK25529.1 aquaporin family protein [Arthrobacter crusticola]
MTPRPSALFRRACAEFIGSAALTAMVVGSGIAAVNLSQDAGLQLLINAFATALGLFVLISVLAPISGAHFNPLVTTADYAFRLRPRRELAPYIAAQVTGCIAGSVLANVLFDLPPAAWSSTGRITPGHLAAEVVATAGLVLAVFTLARTGRAHLAPAVAAAYIGSAYFFTSSTSFANPAITIGRMFTDTFAGIAPGSVPLFIAAQAAGALLGYLGVRLLIPAPEGAGDHRTSLAPPPAQSSPPSARVQR